MHLMPLDSINVLMLNIVVRSLCFGPCIYYCGLLHFHLLLTTLPFLFLQYLKHIFTFVAEDLLRWIVHEFLAAAALALLAALRFWFLACLRFHSLALSGLEESIALIMCIFKNRIIFLHLSLILNKFFDPILVLGANFGPIESFKFSISFWLLITSSIILILFWIFSIGLLPIFSSSVRLFWIKVSCLDIAYQGMLLQSFQRSLSLLLIIWHFFVDL